MRLTADIVLRAECFTNAIKERELNLRGFKISAIENLAALQNQVDCIDFTDNDIRLVENFPKMSKLTTLLLISNSITRISSSSSLLSNLSNLTSLVLTNNNITQLTEVYNIAGFKKLEVLSLIENPVSLQSNYRNYAIVKIPSLKWLDFMKVQKTERSAAESWAKSKEGKAFIAQVQADAITKNAASSGSDSGSGTNLSSVGAVAPSLVAAPAPVVVKRVFTDDEKRQIRSAIELATSPEQMDAIERQLKHGTFKFTNGDNSLKRKAETVLDSAKESKIEQ